MYEDPDPPQSQQIDYVGIRADAYELVQAEVREQLTRDDIFVREMDRPAIAYWRKRWAGHVHPSGYGGWDWERLWHSVKYEPESPRCAVWCGEKLCGLAVGYTRSDRVVVTHLEGDPLGHPLRGAITRIVLPSMEYYARGLEIPYVALENPAEDLEGWYRNHGFTLAYSRAGNRYLSKSVE